VGTALAFTSKGLGDVYCDSSCPNPSNIVIDDQNGTTNNPCGNGSYFQISGGQCTQFSVGTHKFRLVDL
jgi:hypothetical protein